MTRTTGVPELSAQAVGRWVFLAGIVASSWTELELAGVFLGDLLFFSGGSILLLTRTKRLEAGGVVQASVRRLLLSGWLLVLAGAVVAVRHPGFAGLGLSMRMALVLVAGPIFMLAFVRTVGDALLALAALLASAAVNGLFTILDMVVGLRVSPAQANWNEYPPLAMERAVGLTGHPNLLGYLAAVTLPIVPALIVAARSRRARAAVALAAVLIGSGLLLSGSRGGALGAMAGLLYVGVRSGRRRVRAGVVGLTLALVVLGTVLQDATLFSRLLGDSSAVASDAGRRADLAEGLRLAVRGFPTGVGLSQVSHVHSGVLAIVVAAGVLGLASLCAWGLVVYRSVRRVRLSPDHLVRVLAVGTGGGTIGMAVFLLVSPIIFHRYAVVPASVAVALVRLDSDRRRVGGERRGQVPQPARRGGMVHE